jgi:hypothetical protein
MARSPTTQLCLSESTRRYLEICRVLSWVEHPQTPRAYNAEAVLGPMLKRRAQRLRARAREVGYDPDELLRLAETGSREAPEPFHGVPVRAARVDE